MNNLQKKESSKSENNVLQCNLLVKGDQKEWVMMCVNISGWKEIVNIGSLAVFRYQWWLLLSGFSGLECHGD